MDKKIEELIKALDYQIILTVNNNLAGIYLDAINALQSQAQEIERLREHADHMLTLYANDLVGDEAVLSTSKYFSEHGVLSKHAEVMARTTPPKDT